MWYRSYVVPIIFWIPEEEFRKNANTDLWVSHLDIFPTIKSLALENYNDPLFRESLFFGGRKSGALTFNSPSGGLGTVISDNGVVELKDGKEVICYKWAHDSQSNSNPPLLVLGEKKGCTKEQLKMARLAIAKRALIDFMIRKSLFNLKE